ncbi:MAG: TOPRIM nucleotidyl transferase/hydrolase domain-containing protein [Burkholderiaceae bacterium]
MSVLTEFSGTRPPLTTEAARNMVVYTGTKAVILVEGLSDQAALEALASRRGLNLMAERVLIVCVGGATNTGKFLDALGPPGLGVHLAGLVDADEEPHLWRQLERVGLGANLSRASAESRGFFVCDADLEDELIRALGAASVEGLLAIQGELESFRRFQNQPAQRARQHHAQLRRFLGTRARRKIRYGALLTNALEPDHVPRVLDGVLTHARR